MNISKGKIAKAQKIILYGVEGIGKSTFAAQFPEPLFIDTEGSTSNMDVARFDKPTSWTMLTRQILFVRENRPCKTLIIDTIDWAERMAIEHMCVAADKKSIEDFGYGQGFTRLTEELGKFLNSLQDLVDSGINVVLTAHAQVRKFELPEESGAFDKYELKLGLKTSARTSALVKEWADMVLFANYKILSIKEGNKHKAQGGQRVIYTTPRPTWDAKNRFNLPDEIPMDFSHIAHIFNVKPTTANEPRYDVETGVIEETETVIDPSTIPPLKESADNPFPTGVTTLDYSSDEYMGVPQTLLDLMKIENVTAKEIMDLTHQKFIGTFPSDMVFNKLPHDFINQALIPKWDNALAGIKENRK